MTSARPVSRLTFKVLTINAHKGFTAFNRRFILHELRDAIRQAAPDVVFLQEVQGEHQRHAARLANWPLTSHYEFLADTLWKDYAYGRNAVYPGGDHGNAILSKYPISTYQNHDVSVSSHEARGLLHCVLTPPFADCSIHAICAHLGLRERHRRTQMQQLCELVSTFVPKDQPLIIAGDFNDWRQYASRALQTCGVVEVFTSMQGRPVRTFPARWPVLRLDRIYVRNVDAWRPINMSVRPWSRLSDHIPLAAEIDI